MKKRRELIKYLVKVYYIYTIYVVWKAEEKKYL